MIFRLINTLIAFVCTVIHGVLYFIGLGVYDANSIWIGVGILILCFVVSWLITCLVIWLLFIAAALTTNPKKDYPKLNKFYVWLLNSWYYYFIVVMHMRLKITGYDKVPFGKRFVVVSNHRSNFDHMILSSVLRKEYVAFISKPENFKIPIAGRLVKRTKYLPIERGNLKQALQTILKAIEYIKNDEMSIGVFPEGTRSKTGEILEFKPGCFKIPEKANCPLVVVCMNNTEKIHKNFPFKHTNINFDVLKVYSPEELKGRNTVDVSDEVRNMMIDHLKEINSNQE